MPDTALNVAIITCGAIRSDKSLCTRTAGIGTNHVGTGLCNFHQPRNKAGIPQRFDTKMIKALASPDLLALDRTVAALKVMTAAYLENWASGYDAVEEMRSFLSGISSDEDLEEMNLSGAGLPTFTPEMEKVMELHLKYAKAAFEMRFAKRFSIPTTEVTAMVQQLAAGFNRIAVKYGIPIDAVREFSDMARGIKLSGGGYDPQLAVAGGEVPVIFDNDNEQMED